MLMRKTNKAITRIVEKPELIPLGGRTTKSPEKLSAWILNLDHFVCIATLDQQVAIVVTLNSIDVQIVHQLLEEVVFI